VVEGERVSFYEVKALRLREGAQQTEDRRSSFPQHQFFLAQRQRLVGGALSAAGLTDSWLMVLKIPTL
jgi:hypothetical protein